MGLQPERICAPNTARDHNVNFCQKYPLWRINESGHETAAKARCLQSCQRDCSLSVLVPQIHPETGRRHALWENQACGELQVAVEHHHHQAHDVQHLRENIVLKALKTPLNRVRENRDKGSVERNIHAAHLDFYMRPDHDVPELENDVQLRLDVRNPPLQDDKTKRREVRELGPPRKKAGNTSAE